MKVLPLRVNVTVSIGGPLVIPTDTKLSFAVIVAILLMVMVRVWELSMSAAMSGVMLPLNP